mgnify:CR=1 FL=1
MNRATVRQQPQSEPPRTVSEVLDRLVSLERRTSLCGMRIGGFPFWDALRMKFFYSVTESLGIYGKAQRYRKPGVRDYLEYLYFDLRSFRRLLLALPSRSSVLFLASARRKWDAESGTFIDPVTDPVIAQLSASSVVLESRLGGRHSRPVKPKHLYYYDVLLYIGGLLQSIFRLFLIPSARERKNFRNLEQEFQEVFGARFPLGRAARDAMAWHRALVPLYSWFLRKARVKSLVMVCSYGKESWIEACARCGVRTIELQHGTITRFHPGYHYPQGTDKRLAPDEFWGFGEYWTRTVRFPSRTMLRPGFGFPYLENAIRNLDFPREDNLLLVISQGTIGGRLSRMVVDGLDGLPGDVRILYKLHPGERLDWRKSYPWLADHSDRIEVIEGDSPDLYELMARSRWQLGVNSTALFEGMRLGCRTILADLPGIEYMEDLVASGQVALIQTAAELPSALESCPEPNGRCFFDCDESMIRDLDDAGGLSNMHAQPACNSMPLGKKMKKIRKGQTMYRVIHVSSVHSRNDARIFQKECKTLSAYGFETVLLVADGLPKETRDSIEIYSIKKSGNRLLRMFTSSFRLLRKSLELDGDIYHLHDPELIPLAVLLKLRKTVVFDFHEDVALQILSKPYFYPWLAKFVSIFYSFVERAAIRYCDLVVAATPSIGEKMKLQSRNVVVVNNYPRMEEFENQRTGPSENPTVVYVGGITKIRGIQQMVDALELCSHQITLKLAGVFHPAQLMNDLKLFAGWGKVNYMGSISRVKVAEVLSTARAGLVLFQPVPNHTTSQPNKMFEYMSAGIPVIASDFPEWKKVIEGNQCGICVDPRSPRAIADAIDWVLEHPDEAEKMGERGKAAIQERFNWEIEAKKLISAYKDLGCIPQEMEHKVLSMNNEA